MFPQRIRSLRGASVLLEFPGTIALSKREEWLVGVWNEAYWSLLGFSIAFALVQSSLLMMLFGLHR